MKEKLHSWWLNGEKNKVFLYVQNSVSFFMERLNYLSVKNWKFYSFCLLGHLQLTSKQFVYSWWLQWKKALSFSGYKFKHVLFWMDRMNHLTVTAYFTLLFTRAFITFEIKSSSLCQTENKCWNDVVSYDILEGIISVTRYGYNQY